MHRCHSPHFGSELESRTCLDRGGFISKMILRSQRERVGKKEGEANITGQMFWATGAHLHCTLMGISQKAYWRVLLGRQEAAALTHQVCTHWLEVALGAGRTTVSHLLPGSFSTGKAPRWPELELSTQGESELSRPFTMAVVAITQGGQGAWPWDQEASL